MVDFQNLGKYWSTLKTHGPISLFPIIAGTLIYLDWSKTQRYKARKAAGLPSEFHSAINLK